MTRRQTRTLFAFYFILFAFWTAFNSFYSFHPTDDGFILAYAWRILHGETIWKDFVYVRAPLSPYLFSFWMRIIPENYIILFGRIWFYFSMIFSAALLTFAFVRTVGKKFITSSLAPPSHPFRDPQKKIWLFLLPAGSSCIWTFHHFPPMPWHTIDGIVFSQVSLALLELSLFDEQLSSSRRKTLTGLAGAAATCACLAKQNFGLIPVVFGAVAVALTFPKRRYLQGLFYWIGCVLVLAFFYLLIGPEGIQAGLNQLSSASSKDALIATGFHNYLPKFSRQSYWTYGFVLIIGSIFILDLRSSSRKWGSHYRTLLVTLLSSSIPILLVALPGFNFYDAQPFSFTVFHICLLLIACHLLYNIRQIHVEIPFVLFGLGSLFIAWSGSISWSVHFPILGLAPLGLICQYVILLYNEQKKDNILVLKNTYTLSFLVSSLCFLSCTFIFSKFCWQFPYRDTARSNQTVNLASILPRFGKIYSNTDNAKRISDLKSLFEEVGGKKDLRNKIAIMPEFPIFYFLTNTRNPASIDWWLPMEYPYLEGKLYQELNDRVHIVIMEVLDEKSCQQSLYRDPLSQRILAEWSVIKTLGHFCALKNPKIYIPRTLLYVSDR